MHLLGTKEPVRNIYGAGGAGGPLGAGGAGGPLGAGGAGGAGAAGGAGGAGGEVLSPFTSGALIRNRDGIVGNWERVEGTNQPTPHPFGAPGNVGLWSGRARSIVFAQELLQPLEFALSEVADSGTPPTDQQNWATLNHRPPVAPNTLDTMPGDPGPPFLFFAMRRPTVQIFAEQMEWLRRYADLRMDRASEILSQVLDFKAFYSSIMDFGLRRTEYTLEMLEVVHAATIAIEMRFKNAMACRRPSEISPQVQPIIQTPGHSALPSGHSTEAYAIATVLSHLADVRAAELGKPPADDTKIQLQRQAFRIAANRTVAGVHFPVDSAAGAYLGMTLGTYFVARMYVAAGMDCDAPNVFQYLFDGRAYRSINDPNLSPDFDPTVARKAFDGDAGIDNPAYQRNAFADGGGNDIPMPISPVGSAEIGAFWSSVLAEWS